MDQSYFAMGKALFLGIIALGTAHLTAEESSSKVTGRQIIEKYLETQKVDSELAFIDMETLSLEDDEQEPKKHRFLALSNVDASGAASYLIRIMRPFEVEGLAVLSIGSPGGEELEQYLFLPAVGKASRLTAQSSGQSFLGSDFSYEDLIREAPTQFDYKRLADKSVAKIDCYVVRASSVEGVEQSAYAYRDLFIEKKSNLLQRIDFYGEGDERVKMLQAYGYKSKKVKGETYRPRRAVMMNYAQNSKTTFTVIQSKLNIDLDPTLFTTGSIETWTSEEVRALVFGHGFTVTMEKPDLME